MPIPSPVTPDASANSSEGSLFDQVGTSDPQTSMFDNVDNQQEQAKPIVPPAVADKTARLAAIGQVDPTSNANDLLDQYTNITNDLKQQITNYGDMSLRTNIAANQQISNMKALAAIGRSAPTMDPSGQLAQGVQAVAQKEMATDIQNRATYALEQQAVQNIQNLAQSDPTQAAIMRDNFITGGAEGKLTDINTRRLILDNALKSAQVNEDKQPWLSKALEFVSDFVDPVGQQVAATHVVDGALHHWEDSLLSGRTVASEGARLFDSNALPLSSFLDYVTKTLLPTVQARATFLGFDNRTTELNILSGLTHRQDPLTTNIGDAARVSNLLMLGELKAVTSIPGLLIRNGARNEAMGTLAKAATEMATKGGDASAAANGLSAEETINGLHTTATNPGDPVSVVSPGAGASDYIDRSQEIIDKFGITQPGRWANEGEFHDAIDTFASQLSKERGRPIKDISVDNNTLPDNSSTTSLNFSLGKADGTGFSTERQAGNYLARSGLTGTTLQDESGMWFGRVQRDMPETGLYTTSLEPKANLSISRYLLNSRQLGDELLGNIGQLAGNNRNKVVADLRPLLEPINKLSAGSKSDLANIMQTGEQRGEWYSTDQLNVLSNRAYGRDITTKEIDAYHAARQINDVEYKLRNTEAFKSRAIRGMQSVSFDAGGPPVDRANAFVDPLKSRIPPNVPMYDLSTGTMFKPGELTDAKLSQLASRQHISLEKPMQIPDGRYIKDILSNGSDFTAEPLRTDQINYRPGGHRIYEGQYFAKQAVIKQGESGKLLLSPNTYMVGKTSAEVDFWTTHMEAARLAAKDGADADVIDRIFNGHPGFDSGKQFLDNMRNGVYEADNPFRTMFDRQQLPEYSHDTVGAVDYRDPDQSSVDQYLGTKGRLYYSAKGDVLPDWQGNQAAVLDPYQTIDDSLRNIANITSFSDYKQTAVERWVNTFNKNGWLDPRSVASGASDFDVFMNGKVMPGVDPRIATKIESQRDIIMRNLSWKDPAALRLDQEARNFSSWVGGSDPGSWRNKMAQGINYWTTTGNPVQKMKNLAFDLKLGLFNPGMFFTHLSTATAAMSVDPVRGVMGMNLIPAMTAYLSRMGDEGMLEHLANTFSGLGGFADKGEFKDYMRTVKNSGVMNISGNTALLDSMGPSAALSGMGGAFSKTVEAGRFFFDQGLRTAHTVSSRIAWDATQKSLPLADTASTDFQRLFAGNMEKYSMSMSHQSVAYWQRGLTSIPTQFWAWNVRMIEAMTGSEFTTPEKLRLFTGQALLYGAAGIPGLQFASSMFNKHNGSAPSLDSMGGLMERGFLDEGIYHLTGADVQASAKYGSGKFLTDIIEEMTGSSPYGDKSVLDVAGGAPYETIASVGASLADVAKYVQAEGGQQDPNNPLLRDSVLRLASNATGLGMALKAYMVTKYGEYVTSKGTVVGDNIPHQDAFAVALGLEPGQMADLSAKSGFIKDYNKNVKDASKVVQNYRAMWANQPDDRTQIQQEISLFVNTLPPDVKQGVLKDVVKNTGKSYYDTVTKQVQRRQQQDTMISNVESNNAR